LARGIRELARLDDCGMKIEVSSMQAQELDHFSRDQSILEAAFQG